MSTILHRFLSLRTILFFLCALGYTTGCGKLGSIEEETRPYVDTFKAIANSRGLSIDWDEISIAFKDLDGNIAGTCYSSGHIDIDPDSWKRFSDEEREVLVFHELGHCVLGRDHTEGTFSDNAPVSIMNPIIMYTVYYKRRRDYYRSELFDNAGTIRNVASYRSHTECH